MAAESERDEAYKMLRMEAVCVSKMVVSTTSPHIRIQNNKCNNTYGQILLAKHYKRAVILKV
jgi:hypothetical protein